MVALMKYTRHICRLLGLGNGPSVQQQQQEDQMDYGAATPDPSGHTALSKDAIKEEEELSEEEKARRRAERRKAKKKRRRKRKKPEQVVLNESGEGDEDEGAGADSELDESESEAEVGAENLKTTPGTYSYVSTADMAPSGIGECQKTRIKSSEEDPEWDKSSAFFANAASHIRPKGSSRRSKENKENESKRETNGTEWKKSESLTEKGIKLVQQGQYVEAVALFTEAIRCDPKDYRIFGNRSYCYYCLEQYPEALTDAERAIQLDPDWPKGHFRQGRALMGLRRYSEAERAMEQVLKLDTDCEEAAMDLLNCKVLQLMELHFEEGQSLLLLEKYSTVPAVLAAYADVGRAGGQDQSLVQPGSPCRSLWVGNVTTELTEKHLWDLFKACGDIESIRVLHERFCAFVNFKSADAAAHAMEKLNGYCIKNTRLVVRYPDRRPQRVIPVPLKTCLPVTQQAGLAAGPRRRGPVNGDECYFWRTTGCHFGDNCHYKHIPDQKGKDRKPWQP
ncbi:stress-induced-phosphoprotein 1 isoform X1 [Takifugu flavidus]|uniref:stress-induced-phosphoprotein 1 isoform X1 n=2 Tax=Takifugu flavidus TaxID=433684 RepID=UPI0025442449|nr:stress-induced-phosphoprotein 1 isoform X1 [Takifugu flavidus]